MKFILLRLKAVYLTCGLLGLSVTICFVLIFAIVLFHKCRPKFAIFSHTLIHLVPSDRMPTLITPFFAVFTEWLASLIFLNVS